MKNTQAANDNVEINVAVEEQLPEQRRHSGNPVSVSSILNLALNMLPGPSERTYVIYIFITVLHITVM